MSTWGYVVETAGSAAEAIAHLEASSRPFDAVLSDVGLPDRDGYALLQEIVVRHPNLRVVLMTGYAEQRVISRCRQQGIPVLYKPFSMRALSRALSSERREEIGMSSLAVGEVCQTGEKRKE